MLRSKKSEIIDKISYVFANDLSIVMIKNDGVASFEIKKVRLALKSVGVSLMLTKNNLLSVAAKNSNFDNSIVDGISGSNMMAFASDPFLLVKNVRSCIEQSKLLNMSSIYIGGALLKQESMKMIMECSSVKDMHVIISRCLMSSVSGFCIASNALTVKMARVLNFNLDKMRSN